MHSQFLKIILGLIAFGIFGFFVVKNLQLWDRPHTPFSAPPSPSAPEKIAQVIEKKTNVTENLISGRFSLTDHTGKKRTHLDFRGRITLVYFGYTYCPDICPQALSNISAALNEIAEKAQQINVLFISVDPARDHIDDLARYRENFHPRLVALTGSEEEIKEATNSFRAYFSKVQDGSNTDYLVDHSSIIYVMDQRGRFITSFNHETSPKEIVTTLLKML